MKKRIINFSILAIVGSLLIAVSLFFINDRNVFDSLASQNVVNTVYGHYDAVEPTDDKPGCREFWISCQTHEVVFEEPDAIIEERGTPSEEQIKSWKDDGTSRYLFYSHIILNSNGGILENNMFNLNYGDKISLPVPSKKDCAFYGWYLNTTRITDEDGLMLSKWISQENATFKAMYGKPIFNKTDLVNISNDMKENYVLANDIDLGGIEWTPIGSKSNVFQGTLDGCNFKIKNFKFTKSYDNVGIFNTSWGTIKNLTISNATADITTTSGIRFGFIAGNTNGGTLSNILIDDSCTIKIKSTCTNNLENIEVGSIGGCNASQSVSNCYNYCSVSVKSIIETSVGGIFGYKSRGEIFHCANYGDIKLETQHSTSSSSLWFNVAGLIGEIGDMSSKTISCCFNKGEIIGISSSVIYAGGLVGFFNKGYRSSVLNINNSYNQGDIQVHNHPNFYNNVTGYIGGIIALVYSYSDNDGKLIVDSCYSYSNLTNRCTIARNGGIIYQGIKTTVKNSAVFGTIHSTFDNYSNTYLICNNNCGNENCYYNVTTCNLYNEPVTVKNNIGSLISTVDEKFFTDTLLFDSKIWNLNNASLYSMPTLL